MSYSQSFGAPSFDSKGGEKYCILDRKSLVTPGMFDDDDDVDEDGDDVNCD